MKPLKLWKRYWPGQRIHDPIENWTEVKIQYDLIDAVKPYVDATHLQAPDAEAYIPSTELLFYSPYNQLTAIGNLVRSNLLLNNRIRKIVSWSFMSATWIRLPYLLW